MLKPLLRTTLITAGLVLVVSVVPAAVFANETEDESADDSIKTTQIRGGEDTSENKAAKLQAAKEQAQENRQKRLSAAKLKVCEKRQTTIANIMKRSATRTANQLAVFDKIATRVQDFYVKKGNTLENYDQLVAAVTAARAEATTSVNALKNFSFSCDSDDPKGNADEFKAQLRAVQQDLKDYRTAIKNLILGVKSVNGEARKQEDN